MKIIVSLQDLAWTLRVPLRRLEQIAENPAAHYNEFQRPKGSSKTIFRTIRNPKDELKAIQRSIKDRIFGAGNFGNEVQGGVKGRSPKTNAEMHLGARVLVNADVKNFYDSIDHRAVFKMLRQFGFGTDVARLLTKLTTRKGLLPQGAPTSTVIANLVLRGPLDKPTLTEAAATETTFTRFIDDIALSGDNPAPFIGAIAQRLSSVGLSIHRGDKLRILPRSVPHTITGLNINSGRPTVPRHYRDNVRAAIHQIAALKDTAEREKAVRKVTGRIAYVRQFQPAVAQRLKTQLERSMH
jgi:hypothetical protein